MGWGEGWRDRPDLKRSQAGGCGRAGAGPQPGAVQVGTEECARETRASRGEEHGPKSPVPLSG